MRHCNAATLRFAMATQGIGSTIILMEERVTKGGMMSRKGLEGQIAMLTATQQWGPSLQWDGMSGRVSQRGGIHFCHLVWKTRKICVLGLE